MKERLWDIPGGIHVVPDHKAESTRTPISDCPIPQRLIIPLLQHIGPAAEPCVSIGDTVLKGQKIADNDARTFAPIHASSSGRIADIGLYAADHPQQRLQRCIVIETDGSDEWVPHQGIADYSALSSAELMQIIREAGIAGLGGAGFPTAAKLQSGSHAHVDTVVVNGMECEPYITCDDMLMREHADDIIQGAQIVQHILGAQRIIIGLEDNKPQAAEKIRQAAEQYEQIKVAVAPTLYPSGAARQTVQILTGREAPADGYTVDVGVFCLNTGTAAAIYRAVVLGEPMISRITTVTGLGVSMPGNYNVRLGTPISFLLEQAGADFGGISRLIVGGPMMGFSLDDAAAGLSKMNNCIIAGTAQDFPPPPPELPCIRCGNCTVVCPASLLPQQLYYFAKGQDFAKAQHYNLDDCIECGACSYVCPSTIPLVQYFRHAKSAITEKALEEVHAQQARSRFEARQARLSKEEAEKERRKREKLSNKPVSEEALPAPSQANDVTVESKRTLKPTVDPVFALQTAYNAAQKKLKSAEAALAIAISSGAANQADMEQKIQTLKLKADTAKKALDEAKQMKGEE